MDSFYLFMGLLSVCMGYALGLGSKWFYKESFDRYLKSEMDSFYKNMSQTIAETENRCNALIEKAQSEALQLYRAAVNDVSNETANKTDLN